MRAFLFAPVAALGVGVLLISGMREQYAQSPREKMTAIKQSLAGYTGVDQIIDDEEQRVAGMSDYMLRTYGPDSAPVFTAYVGYYDKQVQGKSIHSPKNCLPGAGWEILNSSRIPLPAGTEGQTVNRVLLANQGVRALVYYWYQGRGRVEASEYAVKWNLLRDAAVYGRTEETLVRIVVPLVSAGSLKASGIDDAVLQRADELASKLSSELARQVDAVLPVAPRS